MSPRLIEVLDSLVNVLSVVFLVYLALKGPTRHLKIGLVVLVLAVAALQAVKVGVAPALTLVGTILALNVVAMMGVALVLRYPLQKRLLPLEGESWPKYATKQVDEFTRKLEERGFRSHGDRISTWTMAGKRKRAFIRFMNHESASCWAEIHALDEPRLVGRVIVSTKQDGTVVSICDRQANEEFFSDPPTHVQRVATASSCAEMLAAHQACAKKVPGPPQRVEDPIAVSSEVYERRVSRLLASGQIVARRGSFAIPFRRSFTTALRAMAAWFH